jgi:hypothetical protein
VIRDNQQIILVNRASRDRKPGSDWDTEAMESHNSNEKK